MSNIQAERVPNNPSFATLLDCVSAVNDPRINRGKKHPLGSVIILTICSIIGGANSWVAVEEFGELHKGWFIRFLDLPHGIPSHDTIGRIFSILDTKQLMGWLSLWLESVVGPEDEHLSIDGKVVKALTTTNPLIILRAWSEKNRVVLAQLKVPKGTNEITAIPTLLNMLDITNKIITIDAIGTQKNIADLIVKKGGHYVLPIKGNQHQLYSDVKLYMDDVIDGNLDANSRSYFETSDTGHGRHEIRRCWTTNNTDWYEQKHRWTNMKTISAIESERTIKGVTSITRRYFISDLDTVAQRILTIVRNHWSIENGPHWALDVVFEEDKSTVRVGNSPQNFAVLRSFCLSLLKNDSTEGSMRSKRLRANCNFTHLMKILLNTNF